MPSYDFDLGVIGAGSAGLSVVAGAARLGVKTLLVEREPELGGDCLHYGCVPSKTLIKTARVYHQARNFPRYGLPGASLPPVDYAAVSRHIRGVIEKILVHDSPERFRGLGAQVEFGPAAFVDDHEVEVAGRRYSAARWVVATGSGPQLPGIPGLADTPVLTNRDVFSMESLPDSLVVLGAGPIAIEMAQAFQRLGCAVQVVQRSGQILTKEDPDMAAGVMAALAGEGVVFHLNAKTLAVRDAGSHREVDIAQDGNATTLRASAILVALGREPHVADLKLENAGVAFTAKGVAVDGRMRTNRPHIFAAGDVTGSWQFTHAAGYEAGIVVANAVFHLPRAANYTWMPWCTYCEPELATMGRNEVRAKDEKMEYRVICEEFARNDRALAEVESQGRIKLLLGRRDRPLGVQILGPGAGDLLGEWAAVLGGGVKLSTLAGAVHPYPTLAEINKRVAGRYLAPKLFSPFVRKALRLLFNYRGPGNGTDPADN